jgi:hypothetical protein
VAQPGGGLAGRLRDQRQVHYAAIRTPLDGQQFVADLKKGLGDALTMFNDDLADGTTGGVKIT